MTVPYVQERRILVHSDPFYCMHLSCKFKVWYSHNQKGASQITMLCRNDMYQDMYRSDSISCF